MNREAAQGQAFQELVNEYFPHDAIQVLEDVRVAQQQAGQGRDASADSILQSLRAGFAH